MIETGFTRQDQAVYLSVSDNVNLKNRAVIT